MVAIFAIGQYIILEYVRRKSKSIGASYINSINKFILVIQYALGLFLVLIALQMVLGSSYNISFLKAVVWISSGASVILLSLLAQKLVWWFKHNRNLALALYAAAITMLSINTVFVVLNVTDKLAIQQEI